MKQRLKVFGIYTIFWIVFFVIARLLFLFYEYSFSFNLSLKEWLLVILNGLRMDLSTTGYILGVVGLLLIFTSFTNGKWINRILHPFTFIILIITTSIVIVDLELYRNWGYRMDATPLLYITKPKEAMASTAWWLNILLLLSTIAIVFLGSLMYKRKIYPQVLKIKKSNFLTTFLLLILTGSMILPIRGGIGIAPMNTGMVYFSENKFANHAAINVIWNVMNSLVYRKNTERSYNFMDNSKAEKITYDLNKAHMKSTQVVIKKTPNVVLIILESFSSKVTGAVGGKWDATPRFDQLAKEGLLFTNFYANGDRSDKGILSILSGYPGQPTTSIIKDPAKTQSLPSLFSSFKSLSYKTSFYYGGDIDFANMRSYFLNSGTEYIITVDNFSFDLNDSKWGVHDEHLFDYLYNDLMKNEQPYFKAIFTLSSHDPFEVPMVPVFEGNDRATKFLNSVYYTDSCLGKFFDKIKETDIWNNTLFILVADHGSVRPGNSQNHDIDKFKIPMLWLGGVLNDSIKINDRIGSQIDIPATLLSQLNESSQDFSFSKDMFSDDNAEFAFYAFNDGFCFITDSTKAIYDNIGNNVLYFEGDYEKDIIKGKAYLQTLMNDFISR
jgi:phosphoglycerol transferase MdoB-like AlkP superfamily enzyme